MNVNISVKVSKVNGTIVFMPEIFNNISVEFDNYSFSFEYNKLQLIVTLNSDVLSIKELENVFWDYYSYLGIILGYFPNIISADFADEEHLAEIVEQYKTKECHIRDSEQYIKLMKEEDFKNSFEKFISINKKASFPISMFNVAMMRSMHYPEISMINILQSLDGLYEEIFSNKTNNYKIKLQKLEYLKDMLNDNTINNLDKNDYEIIKNLTTKIDEINFKDKLRFLIDYTKFNVFQYEKQLSKSDEYYIDNLLDKLVNTRNKFSHSIDKNNVLKGTESAVYIFKIIMLYRLLIFKEINIIDLIDEKEFYTNLEDWDNYIHTTLEGENINV